MSALHRLADYLRTSLELEVRGTSPAYFLNLCTRAGIEIWGVRYRDENRLRVRIHARNLRACVPLARKSACRLRITKKSGLAYGLRSARRHPVLLAALGILAALCVILDTRVLSFSFTGYETVTPRRLLAVMEENGLSFGARKASVDASDLRNSMLSEIPELIWFTVTFHGSAASVDVRERTPVPRIARWDDRADIVSDVHGMVRDVSVARGRAKVSAGDIVAPGTVLISGTSPLRLGDRALELHAQGKILADVWYKTTLAIPLEMLAKTPTGRTQTRWALIAGKNRINFYKKDGNGFDNYDKIIKKYTLSFGEGFTLPLTLVCETLVEYETSLVSLDPGIFAQALVGQARRRTLALDVGVECGEAAARQEEKVLYAYAYGTCTRCIGEERITTE